MIICFIAIAYAILVTSVIGFIGRTLFLLGTQENLLIVRGKPSLTKKSTRCSINFFMTEAVIIQKPVHWFAEQINELVSIW